MRPALFTIIALFCVVSPSIADPAPAKTSSTPPAPQSAAPAKAPAQPAQATAPPAAPTAPDAATDAPPPQLFRWATDHLVAGVWYERAIDQLKAAIQKDPQNVQYHLALGCAEADRAASIGYALTWKTSLAAMQNIYPMEMDMWEKGQKDPKSFEYNMPKPQPPPKFSVWTKDDYKELKMTDEQANARIAELSKSAKTEWTQALALCKTPEDRADAEYIQGWGLRLLNRMQTPGGAFGMDSEVADMFGGTAQPSDDLKSLEAATKDDPNNAVYWQSLGDALYRNPGFAALITAVMPSSAVPEPKSGNASALDAYRQSLKINSGNPMLWYRVALLEAQSDPAQALTDLKLAASGDPDNSYITYLAAGWELKQSKFADAFNLLDIIKNITSKAMAQQQQEPPTPNPAASSKQSTGADNSSTDPSVADNPPADARGADSTTPTTGGGDTTISVSSSDNNNQSMIGSMMSEFMPDPKVAAEKGNTAYQDQASRDLAVQSIALIEQGNTAPSYHTPVYAPAVPKFMSVAWGYGNQIDLGSMADLDTMQLAGGACQFAEAAARAGDFDDATRAARSIVAMGLKMMNGSSTVNGIAALGTGVETASMGYSTLEQICKEAGDEDTADQVQAEAKAFEQQTQSSMMQQAQNWMQSFFGSY